MPLSIADEFWFSESWRRKTFNLQLYARKCWNGANLAAASKADVEWVNPLTFYNQPCRNRPTWFPNNYRGICKYVFTIWQQHNCWVNGWPLVVQNFPNCLFMQTPQTCLVSKWRWPNLSPHSEWHAWPPNWLSQERICLQGRRHAGSIPGSRRSPGGGNGDPLQYSCRDNPTDRGAWQATVHRVKKTQTWLSDSTTTSTAVMGVLPTPFLVVYFMTFMFRVLVKYPVTMARHLGSLTQRNYWQSTDLTNSAEPLNKSTSRSDVDGPRVGHTEWSMSEKQILFINVYM